jgi:hypothetical protein
MAAEQSQEPDRPDGCHGPETRSKSPSFADLAKRMSAWTTRGLLTAIILVAGLGLGRQVLKWWAADSADPKATDDQPPAADGLGDPARPHIVRFGNQPWSLRRELVSGSKQAAADALRADCRKIAQQVGVLAGLPQRDEKEFLEYLATCAPVEQEAGLWRIFQLDQGFPMVVGVRESAEQAPPKTGAELARTAPRVVTWGLAVPAGPDAWALYTFQSEPRSGQSFPDLPDVPLPPGCQQTLSMRVVGGGAMIGFEGPNEPDSWTRFYGRWFAGNGWEAVGQWQHADSAWYGRYTATGQGPAATVDVRFAPDGRGRLTGLLIVSP